MNGTAETPERAAFLRRYGHLFEHSPWVVERAFALGPFADDEALHAALMRVVAEAGLEMQRRLIAAHPELGARVALSAESDAEQTGAGLRQLSEAEFARFAALNAAYREKFGLPFVICVRRHDKASILAALARRLAHDAATEHEAALAEIGAITRLRLADLALAAAPA